MKLPALGIAASLAVAVAPPVTANPTKATCSDILDIDVHGQHVVGDYVSGIGHDDLDWSPDGREIGETVAENGGAVLPGGPGPGYHFERGIAPGASFCTDKARSWGVPRG